MADYGKFDLRRFVAKYGPLSDRRDVPERVCIDYEKRLPFDLIGFWRENGIGIWLGGKFQFCIPDTFTDVVDILFTGDPDIDPKRTHIVGYSAFGELLVWNEDLERCEIDLRYSTMKVGKWSHNEFDVKHNPLATVAARLDSSRTYHIDADRPGYASLLDEAVKLIGPIGLGQCYGFFPALALGGSERIEHVQISDAKTHFTMLAEMGPLRIRRLTEGNQIEFLRNAGPQ